MLDINSGPNENTEGHLSYISWNINSCSLLMWGEPDTVDIKILGLVLAEEPSNAAINHIEGKFVQAWINREQSQLENEIRLER